MPAKLKKRFREFDRQLALQKLIQDTMTFDLNYVQSDAYIERRFGKPISRATFYKYKKMVVLDEETSQERMFSHAKAGFVIKHFEIMDKVEAVIRNLSNTMWTTTNPLGKSALARELRDYLRFLAELNVGTPLIDTIKNESAKKLQESGIDVERMQRELGEQKDVNDPDPPSALTLPEGYLDASLYATDDGGGMATRKKPSDRVF